MNQGIRIPLYRILHTSYHPPCASGPGSLSEVYGINRSLALARRIKQSWQRVELFFTYLGKMAVSVHPEDKL